MKADGWAVVGPDGIIEISTCSPTPEAAWMKMEAAWENAAILVGGYNSPAKELYRCVPVTIEGRE